MSRLEDMRVLVSRVRLGDTPHCIQCGNRLHVDTIWNGTMRVYCIVDTCKLYRLMGISK